MNPTPLNEDAVKTFTQQLNETPTARLLDVWQENDRELHSAEEFESIRRILIGRNLLLPPQRNAKPDQWDTLVSTTPVKKASSKLSWIILVVVIGGLCLLCVGGAAALYFYGDQLGLDDITLFSKSTPTPQPTISFNSPTVQAQSLPTRAAMATATSVPALGLPTPSPVKPNSPPDPLYQAWPAVLSDTFSANDNGWPEGEDDNEWITQSWEFDNGLFKWKVKAKDTNLYWLAWPEYDAVTDFYYTIDVQKVDSPTSSDLGIFFREVDDSNFYAYSVNDSTGEFVVYTVVDNDWQELVPWTSNTAVRIGRVNKLGVAAEGENLRFYINDRLVAETNDSTFSSGIIGLTISTYSVNDEATFQFDNLELRVKP